MFTDWVDANPGVIEPWMRSLNAKPATAERGFRVFEGRLRMRAFACVWLHFGLAQVSSAWAPIVRLRTWVMFVSLVTCTCTSQVVLVSRPSVIYC